MVLLKGVSRVKTDISKQIASLSSMPRPELLKLWHSVYGKAASERLRREVIVPCLAYKIQELAYGGLKPSTIADLRRIARGLKREAGSPPLVVRPRVRTGTHLLREWKRETHKVVITESGYEYRGQIYTSLSQIARKITGTRWSGPAFFGLREASSLPEQNP